MGSDSGTTAVERDGRAERAGGRAADTDVARKINGERLAILGWGRAVLLQFAHPLVAAGVAEHSAFDDGPADLVRRTRRTIDAMLHLTFGSEEKAHAAATRINRIHDRVHGTLAEPAGIFPAGRAYSAHDPELLRWVHATLIDSMLLAWDWFVEPLERWEKDRYCAEAAAVGPRLGIPDGLLPATVSELRTYLDGMYASGAIAVTSTARSLADRLLAPPLGPLARPLAALFGLPAVGLLPPFLRRAYGFEWGGARQGALEAMASMLRNTRRLVPRTFLTWRQAVG